MVSLKSLKRWVPAIFIMGVIFSLSATRGEVINASPAGNESTQIIGHFFLFFALCLSFYYATGRISVSVLLTILYGVFDELHQLITPLRSPSIFDIKTDALGAAVAGVLLLARQMFVKKRVDVKKFALETAKKIKPGDILALYGSLGAGKTTFTKHLAKALGFEARVQSPTFIVARKYSKPNGPIKSINHIDLYRLTTKEEVAEIGLEEMLTEPDSITIIEWPELAEDLIPSHAIKFKFEESYVQNLH